MPRNKAIEDVISDAEQIARVWADNPTFTLGELTLAQLQTKLAELRNLRNQIETLRNQQTALTNESQAKVREIIEIKTRALSGIRAVFGPNSTQYEQAGGTPTRERKPRKSKKE